MNKNNTIIYISIVNLSHLFFGIGILKCILYGIYRGGEMGITYIKTICGGNPPLANEDVNRNVDSADRYFNQL